MRQEDKDVRTKKKFVICMSVLGLLMLAGCGSYKKYYTDAQDYTDIWYLLRFDYGYEYGSIPPIFPQSIDQLTVERFFCRMDEFLPLGEGFQILLEVSYPDETDFSQETDRISSTGFSCDQFFPELDYKAYAVLLGENGCSAYALIDQEQRVVYYIYLQKLSPKEIELDSKFIPAGYEDYGEISGRTD